MTVRNVKKNLAGQQDLLPGVGPYSQIRRGVAVSMDGPAKSYIRLWKSYCGDAYVGTFEDGFTATTGDVAVSLILGRAYRYIGATRVTVAKDSSPDSSWSELVVSADSLLARELRGQLSGNWAEGGGELSVNITETVGAGDYRLKYQKSRAALRGGLRDPLPLDDTLNHFRGLPNKDTWGNPDMQGIGSVSFGRNGASYAYLSATFGHDCVVYGAAGFAGGAGSCAGNPDLPLQDAAFGYCSFAFGKMTKAQGRTSNAMGQDCQANSLVSSVDGYAAIAGPGLASHPNGVVSEGRSARAHGWDVQAYGDFAVAMGSHVRSYNGAVVIGSGYDDTHLLQGRAAGGLYLGARCTVPALSALPDGGVRDKLGMHTSLPRERVEAVILPGEKFVVRMDDKGAGGTGTINLQATLPNDDAVNILSVIWNNTSTTSASGVAVVSINGIPSIEITANGEVNFLAGSLGISQNGRGVKLKSPDGSKTKMLRLSNAGALELV